MNPLAIRIKAHIWPIALVGSRNEATIHNLQQVVSPLIPRGGGWSGTRQYEMRWGEVILGDMLCCDVVRSNVMRCGFIRRMLLHRDVILHSLQSYSFECSCGLRTLFTQSTMDAPMTGSMVHGSSSSSSMATISITWNAYVQDQMASSNPRLPSSS